MADDFESECDRLSNAVDGVQFERIRWARTEGPMLERLVELAQATVAERPDFELTDEGSTGACKRFVLKVHGVRVAAVNLGLEGETVTVWSEEIVRSPYKLVDPRRRTAAFADVDEQWMAAAIQGVFSEVR